MPGFHHAARAAGGDGEKSNESRPPPRKPAYYLGRGRAKDAAQAAQWYREAARQGDVGAMYLLPSMYEKGDGVEPDLRLARDWYDLAARAGDEAAPAKVLEIEARMAQRPR